jgi:hypothetical protein
MITFKSTADLNKLSPDDPSHPTVKELIEQLISAYTAPDQPYNAEDYGYIILIEPEDADWVNGELRDMIEDILDPLPSTDTQENIHEKY